MYRLQQGSNETSTLIDVTTRVITFIFVKKRAIKILFFQCFLMILKFSNYLQQIQCISDKQTWNLSQTHIHCLPEIQIQICNVYSDYTMFCCKFTFCCSSVLFCASRRVIGKPGSKGCNWEENKGNIRWWTFCSSEYIIQKLNLIQVFQE